MIRSLKDNPILLYQIRNARWPSLRTAVWMAAGLTVVGMVWVLFPYLFPSNAIKPEFFISILSSLVGLALLACPLLAAVVAIVTTVRAVGSEAYQMMRLSHLSGRDIATGYIAGTLFRLRGLWAFTVGLVLPDIAAWILPDIHLIVVAYYKLGDYLRGFEYIQGAMLPLTIAIFLWTFFPALTWAAANLGVWMAFRLRHSGTALVGTLIPVGFLIAIHSKMVHYLINLDMGRLFWMLPITPFVFCGPIIILGWWAYRRAVKSV